ncbi:hypothetical protein OG967_03030 [Streptomyces phaeochromogenes]
MSSAQSTAEVAAAAATILVGLPFLQQATRQDGERATAGTAAWHSDRNTSSAVRRTDVVPSSTTVALCVVLAAAAFWLTDLLTTRMGIGSLGYLNGKVPDDPS